ncbi:DEAD/DEAH box helicase [Adhaeribacter sp. BT258]|uniref:DEAD/DEAH box helicase n=2 Tax=Adhaeribacter terrigena TaxID=2793070 RepID=A0ABS1C5I9_9BACT|nr:DEAD/DEAH box helicase [Adhaeribacter terrigena]MBK0404624.1 DEAD/DEAH box helicase [Adhaeribacter terrigena]
MGFKNATPVQQQAIPVILEKKDLIACAQTGTGKTGAYLIPLLDRISHAGHDHTSTLILVPTRELAKQIDDQVEGLSYFVSAQSIAIYGGSKGDSWDQQKKALTSGADIIVATPGRLIAHMNMGYVKFDQLEYLVLDEADKMLDMGFMDDIMRIVAELPKKRQTLLFSATMPPKIRDLAKKILNEPAEISLAVSKPAENIDQRFYFTYDSQKLPLLESLINGLEVSSMIVFTSRKSNVNSIVRSLQKLGFTAEGIQSDIEQDEREKVLLGFRNKKYQILVATDIMSRGIDIDNISHVVNFDMPQDAEDYIHRIGRTARAAATGTALTFVNEKDMYKIPRIERLIEKEVPKFDLPDFLGKGPEYDPNAKPEKRGGSRDKKGGKPRSGDRKETRAPRPQGERKPAPKAASPNPEAGENAMVSGTETRENKTRNKNRNRDRDKKPKAEVDNNRPIVPFVPKRESKTKQNSEGNATSENAASAE